MVSQIIASGNMESSPSQDPDGFILPRSKETYSPSKIIEKAHAIKRELTETPLGLDKVSQELIDEKFRQRITAIGAIIGAEAEKRAGFDVQDNETDLINLEEMLAEISRHRSNQKTVWTDLLYAKGIRKLTCLPLAIAETLQTEKVIAGLHIKRLPLSKKFTEVSARLSHSYTEVLSEIRPLGGDIKTRDNSSKTATKILQSTVGKIYPAEWIKLSNDAKHPLALRFGRSGGFYEPKFDRDITDDKGRQAAVDVWEAPEEEVEEIMALLAEGGNEPWLADAPQWEEEGKLFREINFYCRFPQGVKVNKTGYKVKVAGDLFHGYAPTEDEHFPDEKSQYRHGFIVGSEKDGLSPVLNISWICHTKERHQTAYHEFMHHMQNTAPKTFRRLERALFVHKTTTDGIRNPLLEVEGEVDSKNESDVFYREGDFVDPYMGREYPHSWDLELITTGAEALFGHAFGSLMGFHGWDADPEHRNFMLGLFATA
jgi:hypothetical protein